MMSESNEVDHLGENALPCNTIVYRVIRKNWIDEDTGLVKSDAFFLTERDISTGLSVNPAATCSPEEILKNWRKCPGVVTLHVGRLRNLGLEVAIDPKNNQHALIQKMPYKGNSLEEAEHLAGLIARQARFVRY